MINTPVLPVQVLPQAFIDTQEYTICFDCDHKPIDNYSQ